MREISSSNFGFEQELENLTSGGIEGAVSDIEGSEIDTKAAGSRDQMDSSLDEAEAIKIRAALLQFAPVAIDAVVPQVSPDDPKQDSKIMEGVMKRVMEWKKILMATL